MLKNHLKITLRNLWKHKTHTAINVLGLSLGIASAIIIFLIVRYELSFDGFHEKAERIYRITASHQPMGRDIMRFDAVPRPLPEAFRQDFSDDIEQLVVTEIYKNHKKAKISDQTIFLQENIAYTDNGYFTLFDFSLIAGNPNTVLTQPNEAVITQKLSEKLFGQTHDVIGKIFTLDDQLELQVTGIIQDVPKNTDFNFEMLISFHSIARNRQVDGEWGSFDDAFQAYILLPENVHKENFEHRFDDFLKKYAGEKEVEKLNAQITLQPLNSLHFDERYGGFPYRKVSKEMLGEMILLALLLIVLACINFINLATAVSTKRSKEIGVRKVLGSTRRQIILHFLGEAFMVTLLATVLALGFAELGLMQLQQIYNYLEAVTITPDARLVTFLILLVVVVANLAGFYPAWLLSRFKPVSMFRQAAFTVHKKRFTLRQGLVVFQFFISQVFIVCTLVIAQQLDFLKSAPLGFNEKAIITVNLPDQDLQKWERFKAALGGQTGIENMTFSAFTAISQSMYGGRYTVEGKTQEEHEQKEGWLQFADEQYFATHGMKLLAGTVFTPADSGSGFVVNESFVHELGYEQPGQVLGTYISVWGFELPIVGVVADYHSNDFGEKIHPLLITNFSPQYRCMNLKINITNVSEVVSQVKAVWKANYPDFPFEYSFLDDKVESFYKDYERTFTLTQLFSGIAILIGCLGLYGLVLFMVEQRTKEIGIRKVLGATVQQILQLFSKEFVKLVLIAFVLTVPLAYYLMQEWLQNFAYKIHLGIAVFLWCLSIALLLVLLTVGYQAIRAAVANPVDALRDE